MVFFELFLLFFYLKVARVYTKQEKVSPYFMLQHFIVAMSAIAALIFAFLSYPWYLVLLAMWIFWIAAALMITAVQIGIFIDGISLIGISKIYKILPLVTIAVVSMSAYLWLL